MWLLPDKDHFITTLGTIPSWEIPEAVRTIIIPTDFSENAYNAIQYACQLFKYERSDIYLLHCCDPAMEDLLQDNGEQTLLKSKMGALTVQKTALIECKDRVCTYSPNPHHKYITHLTKGRLPDEINDLVDQLNADVVVMGTRGETNDRSRAFGSNTMQVFRYVKSPVLAVPEDFKFETPKHILFPTHFMKPFRKRELKLLKELGNSFRSVIHLLYMNAVERLSNRQQENYQFLREGLGDLQLERHSGEGDDIYEGIGIYLKEHPVQLMVMVNQRHRHQEDMLGPSTVDRLGLTSPVPFLVLQNLYR